MICTLCQQEKPLEAFCKRKGTPTGRRARCKACHVQLCQKIQYRHREAYLLKHRTTVRRLRMQKPQAVAAYARERRAKNPAVRAYHRTYRKNHPLMFKIIEMKNTLRKQRRKHGLPTTVTVAEYEFMLNYWNNACAACGRTASSECQIVADHVIPVVSPSCPGTIMSNLIPLCHGIGGCNNSKKDRDLFEWLVDRFGIESAKNIVGHIQTYFMVITSYAAQ